MGYRTKHVVLVGRVVPYFWSSTARFSPAVCRCHPVYSPQGPPPRKKHLTSSPPNPSVFFSRLPHHPRRSRRTSSVRVWQSGPRGLWEAYPDSWDGAGHHRTEKGGTHAPAERRRTVPSEKIRCDRPPRGRRGA